MRTPTNHEDNQLWREAAAAQARKAKREADINALIDESLDRLRTALRDDFSLSDREIMVRLFYHTGGPYAG